MSRPYLRHQSGRMFENNFLEACSKVHPSVPFIFYIPLTLGFFIWAQYTGRTTVGMSALFVPLGVLTWIAMEYLIHRYFFHWEGSGPFTRRVHEYRRYNHKYPDEGASRPGDAARASRWPSSSAGCCGWWATRRLFDDLDGPSLAGYLVGGMLKADLGPLRATSLRWTRLRTDDFVLPPLPNHLFPRDNSCWVYGGVSINPMAKPARQRETVHIQAVYRYHPLFRAADFVRYYGADDACDLPASIEGGDVHVIGDRSVLIGMGERTTPMAVEILAQALFASGQADQVIALELPQSHAMMHLDTVMTMVDPEHVRALSVLRPRDAILDGPARLIPDDAAG